MRNSIFFLFIVFVLSMTSCREDFDFEPSSGTLEFSKDTVYLDTVFTNIGSSTYRLKVYNRSDKDIKIPSIKLARSDSKYRMMIDGMQGIDGKTFNNVELLAKDSLFIFIETTIDYNEFAGPNAQFLYTDQIQFDAGNNLQTVELVTLVKDAVFLYPARDAEGNYENLPIGDEPVPGFFLEGDEELHWTNAKPYVIYGYAAVPPNTILEVDPGARVHFHADAALIASNGSSIKINGTLENDVVFEGDRLESSFSDTPGQWSAIWLTQGSTSHNFKNLTIKNATVGILVSGNTGLTNPEADLKLENVQIYNSANAGILAQTGYISGENVVINWAGSSSLACTYGGKYNFTHSTFNNNWSGQKYAVLINDFIEGADPLTQPLVETSFTNCIIFGSNQSALLLRTENASVPFNPIFIKCQIKMSTSSNVLNNPLYAFLTDDQNIILNKNPRFLDVNNNKLMIGADSDAIGFGGNSGGFDITGAQRNNPSDLGAYNWTTFED